MSQTRRSFVSSCALLGIIVQSTEAQPLRDQWTPDQGATLERTGPHPVTLRDLQALSIRDVTMELSPDGRLLAYALSNESVWVVETQLPAEPRKIGAGFLPRWSPGGDLLAFYSSKPDGIQLWVFNVKTGNRFQVTHIDGGVDPDPTAGIMAPPHEVFRYSWSPDGRKLVFASRVRMSSAGNVRIEERRVHSESTAPLILTAATPPEWTLSGVFAHPWKTPGSVESKDGHTAVARASGELTGTFVSQLFIVDLSTGKSRRLTREEVSYFSPQWSPDGKTIACASSDKTGPVIQAEAINIYTIDVASGRRTALSSGSGRRLHPSFSTDGKRLAYLGSRSISAQADVFAGSLRAKRFVNFADRFDRTIEKFEWTRGGKSILITYDDGISNPLGRIDPASGVVEPIIGKEHAVPTVIGEITSSRSDAIAWEQVDPVHRGVLYFSAAEGSSPVALIDLYPQTQQWMLGSVEVVHWTNQRGDQMEGALLKPVGYEPGRQYPLIVDAYPSAGGSDWISPMMGNQTWASAGYAVFRPGPRAPHVWINQSRSAEWSAAGKGPDGWNVMVDDVMSGVNEIVSRGIADPDRMCLYGFSNGASVVNYLVTRTNRFRCAVSVAGSMSDWAGAAFLTTGAFSQLTALAGTTVWEDPLAYIQLSAVFYLDRVKTPMLLAAGDRDLGFLLGTIKMYNGLRHAGADVTLLRYPDQAHGFTGAAMEDFWQRQMAFFEKHLKPSEHRPEL